MRRTAAGQRASGPRTLAFVVAFLLASALSSVSALALAPPTPWDGANPFRCTVQNAGQGTTVPDPGADPYCVYFDKTNQNVAEAPPQAPPPRAAAGQVHALNPADYSTQPGRTSPVS